MKTLDEVIKAIEWCTELDQSGCSACPYADDDNRCYEDDALHYLKHLQEIEDEYEELKDWWAEEHAENVPLTMEEFSRMIDTEPIWCQELQEWYLFLAYDDGDNRIQLMTDKGDIETFDEDDLEKYPLYRRK